MSPVPATTSDQRSALDSIGSSRRSLLLEVKQRGEIGVDELAAASGLTASAVRQHLAPLVAEGLVERRPVPDGRGRPRHLYRLTDRGHGLFPTRYGELTTELLDYFSDADPALVDRVFDRRRQRRLEGARARLARLALGDKVAELARILDEDGYLADVERLEGGGWRITEHNCAILTVAHGFAQACSSELGFIRQALPGATVERVAHLMDGAHVCAYLVRDRAAPA